MRETTVSKLEIVYVKAKNDLNIEIDKYGINNHSRKETIEILKIKLDTIG